MSQDAVPYDIMGLAEAIPALAAKEPRLRGFFDQGAEVYLARAPGRLDVMGGIADYSGSLVLEQPIAEATIVAVARAADDDVRIASLGPDDFRSVTLSARALRDACADFGSARAFFSGLGESRWAAYVAGAVAALSIDFGVTAPGGLRFLVSSSVPEGKGVSSSAALEVASLRSLCALLGVTPAGPELALSSQRVENLVVGAPCGVMDQMATACGRQDCLLALLCQPAQIQSYIAVPPSVLFVGIDSGLRHAIGGADYGSVRAAAFMGHRIIAEILGARVVRLGPGRVRLDGDPLRGYLANVEPAQLSPRLLAALPTHMTGRDFLEGYHGTADQLTDVDPAMSYPLRAATLHPIYEHQRIISFQAGMGHVDSTAELREQGQLMYQSHLSYSACGLGSDGTDLLVHLVRSAGEAEGIFGARITGGGSGGTVAVLARREALPSLRALAERYRQQTGRGGVVFEGSSPGAMACPAVRVIA